MLPAIPLLDDRAAGLCVTAGEVRAVIVQRRRDHLSLVAFGAEAVEQGDVSAALVRLAARLPLGGVRLAAALDERQISYLLSKPGSFEDPNASGWAAHQVSRQLGGGGHEATYVVRQIPVEAGEDVLIAWAAEEDVQNLYDVLCGAGLLPAWIGAASAVAGARFSLDASFVAQPWVLARFETQLATLSFYRSGHLRDVQQWEAQSAEDVAAEAALHLHSRNSQSREGQGGWQWAAGHERSPEVSAQPSIQGDEPRLRPVLGAEVPTGYEDATALAIGALYPGLAPLNMLEEGTAQRAQRSQDRAEATRAALLLSGFVFAVLALVTFGEMHYGGKLQKAREQLGALSGEQARVAAARAETRRLRAAMEGLARAASGVPAADALELTGRMIPPGLWLREVTLEGDSTASRLRLRGLTVDAVRTADLLDALSEDLRIGGLRLVRSEVVAEHERQRYLPNFSGPLSAFEVEGAFTHSPGLQ